MRRTTTARKTGTTPLFLALVACTLVACGADNGTQSVRVDLKTDFVSGVEFDSIRVQFGDGDLAESQDRINREADDFLRGQRVASAQVPEGHLPITITLYRSLRPVIARRVSAQINPGVNAAAVVISRSCEGVACPNADPALESCLGGRCVDPRCTTTTPEFCPPAQCTDDVECESVACATPRCTDGVCFSIPDDQRCAAGERCDGLLGCVTEGVLRDAGFDAPALDAVQDGSIDASIDALMDAGTVDVPPLDTSAADVFDAGRGTGEFGPPRILEELTMASTEADDPTLTPDLLQIFFKSARPFARAWTARRSALGEPFGELTELDVLPGETVTSPELREDGLVLFFTGRIAGDFNLYRSTRANLDDVFSVGIPIAEVNTAGDEFAFGSNAGETIAVFSRSGLRETGRASPDLPWGSVSPISELNRTGTEFDSHLIGDGRVIYFAGVEPAGTRSTEIWRAERANVDAPFGPAVRIESVSSSAMDTDPWVSADERVMLFMSDRDGRDRIYVATRDGGVF